MRSMILPAVLLALSACASAGGAPGYRWSVDCPAWVDRGAECSFRVRAAHPDGTEVPGVPYRYQILWPAGGGNPLSHQGTSGAVQKVHARMASGPATLVILGITQEGREGTVAQGSFEVK